MNKKEILELIKTGEGYTLEFKEALSGSIGREICAFANASGGRIILGIRDNGSMKGCILKNSDISKIHDIARNIDPPLNVVIEKADELAIIYAQEGKDKPYAVNGHFYLRVGANSQQLKRDEIRLFFQRENQIFFDRKSNKDFDMIRDFNNTKFKEFINKANISKNLPKNHVLKNLSALTNKHINNAGVLFFCHRATKFFINAVIVCVLYKGTDRVDILDKKEFNEDFISNFNNAYDYVVSKLNTNYIIKGKERINRLELPEEALREAIINSMVHRNYFMQGHIQIDIFLDRVEISNPGNLLFDKKELGKVSVPRNPIIMDLMHRANYVEKIGSGINRMKKLVHEQGLKVVFEITSDWFRIIFNRKLQQGRLSEGLNEGLSGELSEGLNNLLNIIKNNPGIKAKDAAGHLNRPIKTIERYTKKLMDKGFIERKGSRKTGGYVVK